MLHNTGPYGPNDKPVNVSSPLNLGSPVNISHSINNLVKMSQPAAHSNSGPFNFQQYPYNSNSVQSFTSKDSLAPQSITSDYLQSSYRQNGMFHDFSRFTNHTNCEADSLNFSKKLQEDNDVQNLSNHALSDVDHQQRGKSSVAVSKSPTVNNINVTDNVESDYNNRNTKNLKSRTNLSVVSNIENITSRIISRLNNLSNKQNENNKTTSKPDNVKVHDENDLIQLSDIVDDNCGSNDSSQYDSYSDDIAKENDSQIVSNNNSSQSHVNEIQSRRFDKSDTDPLPSTQIKLEPLDAVDPLVVIKVEPINSWTDLDHIDPFQKDINAVSQEDSSHSNVITSENSVAEATQTILNRSKSDVLFECPHCLLLFKHPKRFLIHWKWHSFGHIAEKIVEAKEKVKKRRQRRKQLDAVPEKSSGHDDEKETEQEQDDDEDHIQCKTCSMTFESKQSLKSHRLKVHPAKQHECKVCHKMFLTWHGMKTHMAVHSTEAGFQCDECPKRFKHLHSLAKHKDTHKEKTHGCEECPKKFGSQALLRMHMRCHERAQKGPSFRCTYCAKGFYTTYALQIHERTHRNEKPFTCDICDTSYGTNSSLKRHKKVSHTHSSLKPFECETCHRCFMTEFIRDKHAAREHGSVSGLQYACPMCTCRCSRLKDLQRHMYRAHRKGKKRRKDSDSE